MFSANELLGVISKVLLKETERFFIIRAITHTHARAPVPLTHEKVGGRHFPLLPSVFHETATVVVLVQGHDIYVSHVDDYPDIASVRFIVTRC